MKLSAVAVCPYCTHAQWHQSFGHGNAVCASCRKEFVLTFVNGSPVGMPLPNYKTEGHNSKDKKEGAA